LFDIDAEEEGSIFLEVFGENSTMNTDPREKLMSH
jgi:hypothetical protein